MILTIIMAIIGEVGDFGCYPNNHDNPLIL